MIDTGLKAVQSEHNVNDNALIPNINVEKASMSNKSFKEFIWKSTLSNQTDVPNHKRIKVD